MYDLTDIRDIKSLCATFGFSFKKGFGQNFLLSSDVLERMVSAAGITKDTFAVEIGPGFGTLTQKLAEAANSVLCFEIDSALLPVLKLTLDAYSNVDILNEDFLKCDFEKTVEGMAEGKQIVVAANLPYYISTPILMKLIDLKRVEKIAVMLQKEVAQRVAAAPGGRDYGSLSVFVQYLFDVQIVTKIKNTDFFPPPKVDSAVILLERLKAPRINTEDEEKFFALVRAAFGQRRKTLVNSLLGSGLYKISKDELAEIINEVTGNPNIRAEQVGIEQFARISEKI